MLCRYLLALSLAIGFAAGQTTIPDTPAGHTLRAWIEAFNSGDSATLETYIRTFDPKQSIDRLTAFHNQTGSFELLGIESSEPLLIKFRVKEKASPTVALGSIQVKDAQTGTVENFGLRATPPGAVVENIKLDAVARQRVVDSIAASLKEFYVYPDVAQKMEAALRTHQNRGDYNSVTTLLPPC